ncbi:MAG: hypothetical protein WDA07_11215 [Leucobacter sp.]
MPDFSRLTENWRKWGPSIGGERVSASTECVDCDALFDSSDYSVHLRWDGSWWVVDTVDERNERRSGAALFSSFELVEKYLSWDWATTADSRLASGVLGTDLAKQGFSPDVEVTRLERGYEVCSNSGCAILSIVNATIFSHLMSKTLDEIERMARTVP